MIKHAFVRLSLSLFLFVCIFIFAFKSHHDIDFTCFCVFPIWFPVSFVVFMLANRCLFALGRLRCMDLVQLSDDLVQLSDDFGPVE